MKKLRLVSVAALLLSSLPVAKAQTTIAGWTFQNLTALNNTNPAPSTDNSSGAVSVNAIGMTTYPTPQVATNGCDVVLGKNSDTGNNGIADTTLAWRVRGTGVPTGGTGAGNGWSTNAPVGTQGAQFKVDTTGYTGINVRFDWYNTTQGEANLQLQYTADGVHWNTIPITIPASPADGGLVVVDNTSGTDPNSVAGPYLSDNLLVTGSPAGQDWFTNLTASISDSAAANNPSFAIQIVNASTGVSCVSAAGAILNNNSGNWRFDNIVISGTTSGSFTAPTITPSAVATVDAPFTNTFTDNSAWRADITTIKVNGTVLPTSAYTVSPGMIVYIPSASPLLQSSGTISITVNATGYNVDSVVQSISPGAPAQLAITTQPVAPTGNGGTLVAQPTVEVFDQYHNVATNCAAMFTATPSSGWAFGTGSGTVQALTNGIVTFTNLSATSAAGVPAATIDFVFSGTGSGTMPPSTNSSSFDLPAPATSGFTPGNLAILQEDVSTKNSTFSILEINPSTVNQVSPVNTFPISATGSNALRQSSDATTGRMALSEDGTLVCFTGFEDGTSVTADETTIDPRGAGTLNASGNFALQASYIGLGDTTANQTRSATTLDNTNFYIGDKGGVYTNGATAPVIGDPLDNSNVRSLKSFGGTVYALQQYSANLNRTVLSQVILTPEEQELYPMAGLPFDAAVVDFYLVQSGQNGALYDTLYYIDGTNSTSGAIFKFYLDPTQPDENGVPSWVAAGSTTVSPTGPFNFANTTNGGDGLCAATNASGGVNLYYTTGKGGSSGNSVIEVTDSAAYNQPINLGTFQTLYTAPGKATLKGVVFAPLAVPGTPLAATLTASNITASAATLAGSINPAGSATAYWFNYGTTTGYGSSTATNTLASGSTTVIVTNLLTGLAQGTIYHYQIVATNTTGTAQGTDFSFSTLPVTAANLTGVAVSATGIFGFTFTNATGASFSVLATNNLAAPRATWPVVGQAVEMPVGSGNYQFTNSAPTNGALFYLLRQP